MSHLHPIPENVISAPSRSNLKHIQAWRCASQFHPGPVPPASRLSSIQTTFHLNTCPDYCIPHPSRSRKFHPNSILVPFHRIQVSWCAPQLNPGPISAPPRCQTLIQVTRFVSHLQRGSLSPASRSQDSRLSSIQVPSHSHSSLKICI